MIVARRGLGDASAAVQSIANAIAYAEGYFAPGSPGTVNAATVAPVRNNNPCDLGGAGQSYSSIDAGWNACYGQINAILGDSSSYYTSDESIADIAPTYTGNDNAASWASIVAGQLGLSTSDPLSAVSGGSVAQTPVVASTGLPAPSTGLDLSDLSLTDSSGDLTGLSWGLIALAAGVGIWLAAS
jgi:hypothetical protein